MCPEWVARVEVLSCCGPCKLCRANLNSSQQGLGSRVLHKMVTVSQERQRVRAWTCVAAA